MNNDFLIIRPAEGLGDILFGASPDEVTNRFGIPSKIDDEENDWISFSYNTMGLYFSFDKETNLFDSIEAYNEHMLLWGYSIIGLKETEILKIFSSKGYDDYKIDDRNDSSKCISYDDLSLFLWIEDGKLESIQWGVFIDDDDNTIWPKS